MDKRPLYALPQLRKPLKLLGGLSPQQFMSEYWQKKPLLIRQAIPNCESPLTPEELFNLAQSEDVETRLITQSRDQWQLSHGPFSKLPRLNRRNWTLLVQGVNLHHTTADQLLRLFSFLPDARLDDLMMSYASPGGGVGPHIDSYDVFLLQVQGQREWQISHQKDLTLKQDMPIKMLNHFTPQKTWVLEPGDMLYLPPHIAHNGTAVDACMTCSIGFRAPTYAELADEFLMDLAQQLYDKSSFAKRYTDPQQMAVTHPAALPKAMIKNITQQISKLRWQPSDISQFLGRHLSEPKPTVFFIPPKSITLKKFKQSLHNHTIKLAPKIQALYDQHYFYLNGEAISRTISEQSAYLLPRLADQRGWSTVDQARLTLDLPLIDNCHLWFNAGWLELSPA
ncbi:MAG: cupin domain-containing protein [Ottowia sp.]|nr:cupin domain-containing protein [Ottowia sp.]